MFHLTIMSICSLMNSLSLGTSNALARNVCGLSLSILRWDLCLTNRFFLVIFKKLKESISISGKLEKNQMKKSVAYLQKLFHLISHIQHTYSESKVVAGHMTIYPSKTAGWVGSLVTWPSVLLVTWPSTYQNRSVGGYPSTFGREENPLAQTFQQIF